MAAKALNGKAIVALQALYRQKSTTSTTMDRFLHGRCGPLMHRILYLRPHAAPLSHMPLLTAAKCPSEGN